MKPKVFIASSREGIEIARAVQAELDDECDPTVWDQDAFRPTYGAVESLLQIVDTFDVGIAVLLPDDLTTSRGESRPAVRDNVLFELGMFMARFGRDRTFMLAPHGGEDGLPTDLLGLTTLRFDPGRDDRRAAVSPACTTIRTRLRSGTDPVSDVSPAEARLDAAMKRLGRDLEELLGGGAQHAGDDRDDQPASHAGLTLGRAAVEVDVGRIQDFADNDPRTAVLLPANEYFDDECLTDAGSSLGAFVQHHVGDMDALLDGVHRALAGLATQRVPRAERRLDDSYGIGQTIYLDDLVPDQRVILVSATTERTAIGLRAEPHFLYAAIQSAIETMNSKRLRALVMPVLGAGHGAMPLTAALLFNLLALRSVLSEDIGRHVRHVRIVIYERAAVQLTDAALHEVIGRVGRLG